MRRTLAITTAATLAVSGSGIAIAIARTADSGGHARAVAAANKILGDAPVLPGSTRRKTSPAKILDNPPTYPAEDGLVKRARFWTTTMDAARAYQRLTAKPPAGFTAATTGGDISGPGYSVSFASDDLKKLPAGIAYGELLIAVSALKDGKTGIGVYAETVPQPPRPADENVPTSVSSAALSWTLSAQDKHPLTTTVRGSEASRLVAAFDAMRVAVEGTSSCPADFGEYQTATFVGGGHTWVATVGGCGDVAVVRDGRALKALDLSPAFSRQVNHDLGIDGPKRAKQEQVPDSVPTAKVVSTTGTTRKSRTLHRGRARSLVDSFNLLPTVRSGALTCGATGTVVTLTFTGRHHTWRATQNPCALIAVARDGTTLGTLAGSESWPQQVAAALH